MILVSGGCSVYDSFPYDQSDVSGELEDALEQFSGFLQNGDETAYSDDLVKDGMTAIIALACLQIVLSLNGNALTPQQEDELRGKFGDLCDFVALLEPDGRYNAKRRDTFDLLCLFAPDREALYTSCFPSLEEVPLSGVRDILLELAIDVALWLLQNGYEEAGEKVLSSLLELVFERTQERPDMRAESTLEILLCAADRLPEWVYRQCKQAAAFFEDPDETDIAQKSDFYWAFATACRKTLRLPEAEQAFALCADLRRRCAGPDSFAFWLPLQQRAYMRVAYAGAAEDVQTLVRFIEKIDAHAFPDLDPWLEKAAAGESLFALLTYYNEYAQELTEHLPQLERFAALCDLFEEDPHSIILKKRVAENLYACYFQQKGDLLQAEQHLLAAIESPCPNQSEPLLPDHYLECNYLFLCYAQNDPLRGRKYALSLRNKLEHAIVEEDDPFYYRGWGTLLCYEAMTSTEEDVAQKARSEALAHMLRLLDHWQGDRFDLPDLVRRPAALMFLSFAQLLLDGTSIEELPADAAARMYGTVKSMYTAVRDKDQTDRRLAFFAFLLLLMCALRLHAPDGLRYAQEYEERWSDYPPANLMGAPAYITGRVFAQAGDIDREVRLVRHSLDEITRHWQSATRYLNDQRLAEYLDAAQSGVILYYSALCDKIPLVDRYQLVLQYKALAALAGHERNRFLSAMPDSALLREVRTLQDRVALLEKEAAIRDVSARLEQARRRLSGLEARAAAEMPVHVPFTEINAAQVAAALPENSAILEYYLHYSADTLDGPDHTWVMDLFVLARHEGKAALTLVKLDEAAPFAGSIDRFLALAGDAGTCGDALLEEEFETLSARLYGLFFEAALPYLKDIKRLYIAPDALLYDFPYMMLGPDGKHRMGDLFPVVQIICGRDLLFGANGCPPGDVDLIVGDPLFETNKELERQGPDTAAEIERGDKTLAPLPFSAMEARRVAQLCGVTPFVGREAAKSVLYQADRLRVLHLATHGSFAQDEKSGSALYSACLYLAGAADFLRTGIGSPEFGDGILTADEISRMDLHSVQLAVLSACCSGRTENHLDCVQGLVAAFAAAGVKYVITSLWEANDCATALLMDLFYRSRQKGMDCPEALQAAKVSLRECTVKTLRGLSWMQTGGNAHVRQYVEGLLCRRDTIKPFADPFYWGGFVCHQCRT